MEENTMIAMGNWYAVEATRTPYIQQKNKKTTEATDV